MTFRVKIISPIKIDGADLRRRNIRYTEAASIGTQVEVANLQDGPVTLSSTGDILFCEHAVFEEGMRTRADDFDAILVDCAFDPAVEALREECPVPVFGPMRATLPLALMVASRFSFVARAERQIQWLVEVATRYGYASKIASARALGITYQESRNPQIFDAAMSDQLKQAVEHDGAEAIVMGSTTMALADSVIEAADGAPLFMPGMVAIKVLEQLWSQGLLR